MSKTPLHHPALTAFLLTAAGQDVPGNEVTSPVKSDETVTFYTSAAWPAKEPGKWKAEVHGIIFEREQRPAVSAALSKALGIDPAQLSPEDRALFDERLGFFLADNERGKVLPATIAGTTITLPESTPNGHFRDTITVTAADPALLSICAVLRKGDERCFSGAVIPMPDTAAPMVVSDVDDTIKLTGITNRSATITNTFCKPFAGVPGMATTYQRWAAGDGAVFHYVSGSPWQLYTPLENFVKENSFPAGAWHLKHLRVAEPETILAFLGPQEDYKLNAIRPLLERWKQRYFVLVGDTGEQDPEIYARLAREHPERIARIFLRNETKETREGPRLTAAFKDVPPGKWMLFDKAEELPASLKP
jgi:hypothetical protein